MNKKFSQQLRLRRNYQFGFVLLALWLAGCAGLDSQMWVAKDSEEDPRDSFSLGEQPVVFIQGFEGAREVVLQLSCNGKILLNNTFPLHTGDTQISYGKSFAAADPTGSWLVNRPVIEQVNTGDRVLLENLTPGDYEVDLKTNDTVAAVCSFKVVWPPDLENENQAIDSQRQKLLADSSAIQKLQNEITIEKLSLDRQDAVAVNAFNEKVRRYNMLVLNYNSEKAELDARVQALNARVLAAVKALKR